MENKMIQLVRYPGNWSPVTSKAIRFIDMVHWFNKHGYRAFFASRLPDGRLYVSYQKPGCKTKYQAIYPAN